MDVLSFATLGPDVQHVIRNNTDAQRMYEVARYRQQLGLREKYGDALVERCIRGTAEIEACRKRGHTIKAWDERVDGRVLHHFQHNENPEHHLILDPSDDKWPYADGPVGEWVERIHSLRWWYTEA